MPATSSSTTRLLRLGTAVLATVLAVTASAQRLEERITVERILIDARVTDDYGNPVLGLTPANFRVRIDGKLAVVESVDWIPESSAARDAAEFSTDEESVAASEAVRSVDRPPGRLFVLFFQTDFARASSRVAGQMSFAPYMKKFIDELDPEDRVAVFSFDSHLKFRLDFSTDREKLKEIAENTIYTDDPPWPALAPSLALGSHLTERAARDASSSETGLFLLGNALRQIPGTKSLLLIGWGLGRYGGGGVVSMTRDYGLAVRALDAARTSIFVLDFSQADFHSLEVGLGKAAVDTGGTYAKTFRFPQLAIERLQRTLAGHYELTVRRPAGLKVGDHQVDVDLVNHKRALVMARSGFTDRE
jgi:VWFA-related protein